MILNLDMKKILCFATFLLLTIGTISAQTPTTMWANNTDIQWYNNQDTVFTLTTSQELAGLSLLVSNGNDFTGKTILLAADIDLSAHLWSPIGVDANAPFSGTFNGKSHVISNLIVEMPSTSFVGLFGRCIKATLLNIKLQNTLVRGEDGVGSLVGNSWQQVTIKNCHATEVDVKGTGSNIGGLVGGMVDGSSLYRCSSEGSVVGTSQVGGLLGSPYNGNTISECYTAGTVHATFIAGGFVGASVPAGGPGITENVINNCYSRANVSVDSGRVGGFIGDYNALLTLKNSYSTGQVTGPEIDGGFIGAAGNITTENDYWDTITSQHTLAIGSWLGAIGNPDVTPKTTTDMKTNAMVDALNQGNGPWTIDPAINDGYPSFTPLTLSVISEKKTFPAFNVYPNTFTTEIQINAGAKLKNYAIYTLSGKVVQEGNLHGNHAKIVTQALQSGVFILQVNTEKGEISTKIVKE